MAERILVAGLNWIGDAVMSMPALQALCAACPDARVTMLTRSYLAPLWAMHEAPAEILSWSGVRETARRLRAGRFDRACVLPNSFRSALAPALARIPERVGLRGEPWRRPLLTRVLQEPSGHQSEAYFPILLPPGTEGVRGAPRLTVPASARETVRAKGAPDGEYVVLMPGAARGPSKTWPAARFEALARRLTQRHEWRIVLAGGRSDAAGCAAIAGRLGPRAVSLAGETTLPEWAALLSRARLAVANDSGGMHLATAVGTPVVGIYGMTDPGKTGPLASNARTVQASGRRSRDVARDSAAARRALEAVSVESVLSACAEALCAGT